MTKTRTASCPNLNAPSYGGADVNHGAKHD
nr:MAG TPA: hypothetical protein [Caudoviricetes sp.]